MFVDFISNKLNGHGGIVSRSNAARDNYDSNTGLYLVLTHRVSPGPFATASQLQSEIANIEWVSSPI